MNNKFDFDFWKRDFRDRFELNEVGVQLLDQLIYHNPKAAKDFIIDTYQLKTYKCDILDKYCEKFESSKINSLLKQIDYDELTYAEIKEYDIQISEEEETEEI